MAYFEPFQNTILSAKTRPDTEFLCEPFLVGTRLVFVGSYSTVPSSFTENPMRYTDPTGLAAGDAFSSMLEAVKDFAYTYNDDSVRNDAEFSSTIYKYKDSSTGETRYSYTVPNKGDEGGVNPSAPGKGQSSTGYIHTHGAYAPDATTSSDQYDYNIPSMSDQKFAKDKGLPVYTVGPAGGVNEFNPSDKGGYNAGTFINKDWNNVPKDPRDQVNPSDTNLVNMRDHSKDNPYQVCRD